MNSNVFTIIFSRLSNFYICISSNVDKIIRIDYTNKENKERKNNTKKKMHNIKRRKIYCIYIKK